MTNTCWYYRRIEITSGGRTPQDQVPDSRGIQCPSLSIQCVIMVQIGGTTIFPAFQDWNIAFVMDMSNTNDQPGK